MKTLRWWYAVLVLALVGGTIRAVRPNGSTGQQASLEVGDELADVSLTGYSVTFGGGSRQTRISELIGGRACAVLIFFHSECSFCQAIAPDLRNVSRMKDRLGAELPVFWIATTRADKGAARFIAYDSLSSEWYALERGAVVDSLGVVGTPTALVVSSSRRLLANAAPLPRQGTRFPASCSAI